MNQEELNEKTYKSAQLQLVEMRIQWEEEKRERAEKAEALAEERRRAHARWEEDNARELRHWHIGYAVAFFGMLVGIGAIYAKLVGG